MGHLAPTLQRIPGRLIEVTTLQDDERKFVDARGVAVVHGVTTCSYCRSRINAIPCPNCGASA